MINRNNITEYGLLIISASLLLAGMLLPMFSFHKFYFFNDEFSLVGGVVYLLSIGKLYLFLFIFLFSIAAPIYKTYLAMLLVTKRVTDQDERLNTVKRLALMSKWSMADVFVISVLAATVKLGTVASIEIHSGLFVFGLGVVTSMLLVQKLLQAYELRPKNSEI